METGENNHINEQEKQLTIRKINKQ